MQVRYEKLGRENARPVMEIFNDYIEHGTAAFADAPLPEASFPMLLEKTAGYPAYAVVDASAGNVVGFCWLSAYAPVASFRKTAKITSFIARNHVGKGIGKQCLDQLEADARQMGIENIIAEISSENRGSLKFHASNGFAFCGELKNIGYKLNRSFGVDYMQKTL